MTSTEPQAPGDAAPLRLEIIVLDVDDALRAQAGGADRIEVVSAIDRGGLTPLGDPGAGHRASLPAAANGDAAPARPIVRLL